MEKLFGSVHDSVGSTSSDLILKTRGKVKIQIGKKFVDLLDSSGNISFDKQSILNEIDSIKESIEQIQNSQQSNNDSTERKLEFDSLEDAIQNVNKGIVFVDDKIYYVSNLDAKELTVSQEIPVATNTSEVETEVEVPIISNQIRSNDYKFQLESINGTSTLEVDTINERNISNKIVSSTIICIIKDQYILDSIKLNGVFIETNKNIVPEADCIIQNISGNLYKIQYSETYKALMYIGMKLKFDIYEYIKNPDFNIYLDQNKTQLLNKYLVYNYGQYLKGNIQIQFPSDNKVETINPGSSVNHIFQNYTLNYVDDTIQVEWYVDGNRIDDNYFTITEPGTYSVQCRIKENELYNSSSASYTVICSENGNSNEQL